MKEYVVTLLITVAETYTPNAALRGATLDENGELYAAESGHMIGTWAILDVEPHTV